MPNLPESSFFWIASVICPLVLFLCGSIPFGFLIGKWNGVDLRKTGSGNIGATNAWRVLGKKWGSLAFAGDFFKGLVPLLLFKCLTSEWSHGDGYQMLLLGSGIAAILGHNFTPWLGFKGGKGIATSAGVLAAIIPAAFGVTLATWIIVMIPTRTVSIASITACVMLPIATVIFNYGQWPVFVFSLLVGLLGIWRHRSNIARLRAGTEPRFGQPKPSADGGEKK
jgi:acyl phosphate:glycerol-3-phosphate acyltransferase